MITNNLSTLKIHKLSQSQYDRELAAGNIDPDALYLTPDDSSGSVSEDLINQKITQAKLDMYPVGAVYISTTSSNPSTFLGGTWELFGQGKTLVGIDESDTDFNTAEKTGGFKSVTLTTDHIPPHTHNVAIASGTSSANHTHSIPALSGTAASSTHSHSGTFTSGNQSANHSHTITTSVSGGNHRHVVPHNVANLSGSGTAYGHMYNSAGETNAKYSNRYTGYSDNLTFSVSSSAGNNNANHTHSTTVSFNNNGGHTHSVTTVANTSGQMSQDHNHAVNGTTGATGGGTAISNLQPYIAVYMWKKTGNGTGFDLDIEGELDPTIPLG